MQEIKHDGSEGIYKEGNLKDLLEEVEHSLQKKDVAQVIVSTIPGRNRLGGISEDRIRQIVREELKVLLMQADPLYQKVLKESADE